MESAGKRSADTEQMPQPAEIENRKRSRKESDNFSSVDTFAVCNNCNRLSQNLGSCEKCGNPLSEDNAAVCYSSEPKRTRTDTSAAEVVNGNSSTPSSPSPAQTNGTTSKSATPSAVPQALYVNKNAIPGGGDSVRPQTLYMNMNNVIPPSSSAALNNGPQNSTPVVTPGSNSFGLPSVLNSQPIIASQTPISLTSVPPNVSLHPQPQTSPLVSGLQTIPPNINSSSIMNRTAVNRQPPPLQSNVVQSRGSAPSYNLQPPLPQPPPYGGVQPIRPQTSGVVISADNVLMPAHQIRIGCKKFKPLSPVTFKDDGILFTLKDYTYAPVLLNARAIIKCRANMDFSKYPVFFLHLEGSCMRQIKNIFGLRDDEFSATSGYELRKSITIFPATTAQDDVINLRKSIITMFNQMEQRYLRYNKIYEELTPEEALDNLLWQPSMERGGTPNSAPTSTAVPTGMVQISAPAGLTQGQPMAPGHHPPQRGQTNMSTASNLLLNLANQPGQRPQLGMQQQQQQTTQQGPGGQNVQVMQIPPPITMMNDSEKQPVINVKQVGKSNPPSVVIPQNAKTWNQMQKSLAVNGVYHVQMASGYKKYCLWNGTSFIPCQVHATEVQVEASHVRVGSLISKHPTYVSIKSDRPDCISFTVSADQCGKQTISLPQSSLSTSAICLDHCAIIMLHTNQAYSGKIRHLLRMRASVDPTYDPSSREHKRRHIIIFLKSVSPDQRDALNNMTVFDGEKMKQLFTQIDPLKALETLSIIRNNSKVQKKITHFMENTNRNSVPKLTLDRLARELTSTDDDKPMEADSDDDDDVIMTEEEVGVKCPYTQQIMKEPYRNKVCGHSYEKAAIKEFMGLKKGIAKCPYAGCGNHVPLSYKDLEDNLELRDYIEKKKAEGHKDFV